MQTNKPLQISCLFANQVLRKMIFLNFLNVLGMQFNDQLKPVILSYPEISVIDTEQKSLEKLPVMIEDWTKI